MQQSASVPSTTSLLNGSLRRGGDRSRSPCVQFHRRPHLLRGSYISAVGISSTVANTSVGTFIAINGDVTEVVISPAFSVVANYAQEQRQTVRHCSKTGQNDCNSLLGLGSQRIMITTAYRALTESAYNTPTARKTS